MQKILIQSCIPDSYSFFFFLDPNSKHWGFILNKGTEHLNPTFLQHWYKVFTFLELFESCMLFAKVAVIFLPALPLFVQKF